MDQKNGNPPLYLVSSTPEARNPSLARGAAAKLQEGRAMLVQCGQTETVQLLDIVLLQLQMQMHGISDAELSQLCDALVEPRAGGDQLRDADRG